jgi:hypothetical protein
MTTFEVRRCVVSSILSLFLFLLAAVDSSAQIHLSPEPLTRQQEYLLASYGLYDRDGLHLLVYNDSQESLTVVVALEGQGIDIDPARNATRIASKSSRIHLGVSQLFHAADPYPSESYEIIPYVYDDQAFQSNSLFIGEYRYPKIEWKVTVGKSEQVTFGSNTVMGELKVSPQFDPDPPSPEELSLMSGPPSPNLEPFLVRFSVTITRSSRQ